MRPSQYDRYLAFLVASTVLLKSDAFIVQRPTHATLPKSSPAQPYSSPSPSLLHYKLFDDDDERSGLVKDWRSLADAAGNVTRKTVHRFGTNARELWEQGGQKLKALLPSLRREDTEEEKSLHEKPNIEGEGLDRAISRAMTVLRNSPDAVSLLGSDIRAGPPFSQSTFTTSAINGQTSTSLECEVKLEVRGNIGEGTATVTARGPDLIWLELEANNRLYRIDVPAIMGNKQIEMRQEYDDASESENKAREVEVEILHGVRRPYNAAAGIVDAEIVDKEIYMYM